jgi:putative heme-binding domain-containing protein
MRITYSLVVLLAAGFLLGMAWTVTGHGEVHAPTPPQAERPYGIATRTPWTTSRITGTPEPPPPFRIVRAFDKLTFKNPLLMTYLPEGDRFFIGEQAGKIYSFPNDQAIDKPDLFIDLAAELRSWDPASNVKGVEAVYGLVFHPQFAKNRYCYICYVVNSKKGGEQLPEGTRVSRFRVTETDPPRCDPKSEKVIITWLAGGHNGGDLHFGPDGFLYISTGDATSPNPPDGLDTGQDLSDLLSSILRIDVDREENGKAYAIPPDNPFIKTPGARPEIWSYGFRNPWRMSFDRATGDLWVGDVGWELWEMVFRIKRGGNYGWSVMEGRQPVRPESRRGPTPILPPTIDFSHTEAASITGGYVYRGKRLKDLIGAYVCGDWMTGKMWASRFDGDSMLSHREIAQGPLRIVAFGQDGDGELYILHYHETEGTLHQLVPNEVPDLSASFPRKLSETGLFASIEAHEPAPGVIPFSINAEKWADHATAERFVALPGQSTIRIYDRPVQVPPWFNAQIFFPRDGVLAKTITLEMERGKAESRRRLETQILHFDGESWRGYTYRWNDEQTDATLLPAGGLDHPLTVIDAKAPGGRRQQTWHFPGRTECLQCHNPWTAHLLAFTLPQLDKEHHYGAVVDHQLRTLEHIGLVTRVRNEEERQRRPRRNPPNRLVNPYDPAADLNERARSYLHANCAHCHQFGAGGTADLQLGYDVPLEETKTVEVRPAQGTFEIHGAHILSPGDPYRSVLLYRVSKLGPGRMPHIGSEMVDEQGTRLIHDWIAQLPVRKDDRGLLDKLVTGRAAERADALNRLLSSTSSALLLAHALDRHRIPEAIRPQVLAAAMARPESQVRDLFERFLPDEQRIKRLGSVIRPEQVLALKGDATRGKELFFKAAGLQCVNCHRIADAGSTLGPDLSKVATKYTRAQILESILEPSKSIDPQYVAYLVETADGLVHTGLLAEKTAEKVVLKNAGDKELQLPAKKVERLVPQQKSLMPELLLRDLSAEQAADLLEFLASLK